MWRFPALVHTLSPFCPEGNCPLSMVAPDFALWELFLDYPKFSHTSEVGFGENSPPWGHTTLWAHFWWRDFGDPSVSLGIKQSQDFTEQTFGFSGLASSVKHLETPWFICFISSIQEYYTQRSFLGIVLKPTNSPFLVTGFPVWPIPAASFWWCSPLRPQNNRLGKKVSSFIRSLPWGWFPLSGSKS